MGGEQAVFSQGLGRVAELAPHLVNKALKGGADEAQVLSVEKQTFEVNFERDELTLLRSYTDLSHFMTVFCDTKRGSISFTGDRGLDEATQEALEAAKAGLPDPANCISPNLGPLKDIALGPEAPEKEAMVESVLTYLADVKREFPHTLSQSSYYAFTLTRRHFANSNGVEAQESRGRYRLTTCFSAQNGHKSTSFNYTSMAAYDRFPRLMDAGNLYMLLKQTSASFDPAPIPKNFKGDIIVSPDCMNTIIGALSSSLDGYNLIAGLTPFAKSLGESITSSKFSLLNRPRSAALPDGSYFDDFGVATQDLDVIRDGKLMNFLVDFYISNKMNIRQTAGKYNFVVPGGDQSLNELIENTKEGILLSRVSGGKPNRNLDFTGVAKNSFYIKDGQVRYPLTETMITSNFRELMGQIRGLSKESINFGQCKYPWMAAGGVLVSTK